MANHHHQELLQLHRHVSKWERDSEGFTESDVLLAARQLMQLSEDKENSYSSGGIVSSCKKDKKKRKKKKKKKRKRDDDGVESDQHTSIGPCDEVTPSARLIPLVEGVFGGEEEVHWLNKRRRYRDVADIYTATEPVKC
ncbi:hypothetical protein CDL15_Pgr017312 [Punica granatum]|uniref:Uncharacterized protein n=1 Tax=Punica granatum TaxID=22663 RepID=A0A218Y2H3_PUNGR|nr:hypothetical protein CDL15_Pgr017312 [Punica granatum]PKI79338.1 hypothetical protein CRG98_000283 [Punica granatum]